VDGGGAKADSAASRKRRVEAVENPRLIMALLLLISFQDSGSITASAAVLML
jgi:hypothetical protein